MTAGPMRVLLEPPDRTETGLGIAASIVIHLVLVAAIVIAYRARPGPGEIADQLITFMVPPEGQQAQEGTAGMVYVAPGAATVPGTGTGAAAPAAAGPLDAPAGDTTAAAGPTLPPISGDSILTEIEVDSAVERYPWSAAPEYPPDLLALNIQGSVSVTYVVDTTGFADSASIRVLEATHFRFADAVRKAIPGMRFRPAILSGHKVRQLVSQTFSFKIRRQQGDSVPPGEGAASNARRGLPFSLSTSYFSRVTTTGRNWDASHRPQRRSRRRFRALDHRGR